MSNAEFFKSYDVTPKGVHTLGCGGKIVQVVSTDWHYCTKCNASGPGGVPASRKSGPARLATLAKRRAA